MIFLGLTISDSNREEPKILFGWLAVTISKGRLEIDGVNKKITKLHLSDLFMHKNLIFLRL